MFTRNVEYVVLIHAMNQDQTVLEPNVQGAPAHTFVDAT